MTPYELNCFIEVYVEKMQSEKEEKLTLVWLGEYYHRLKKLPSIQKELDSIRIKGQKEMTEEEMLQQVKMLNAMFGGKVKT